MSCRGSAEGATGSAPWGCDEGRAKERESEGLGRTGGTGKAGAAGSPRVRKLCFPAGGVSTAGGQRAGNPVPARDVGHVEGGAVLGPAALERRVFHEPRRIQIH